MKARYICFEGTEGVGKTTQTKKLYEYLIGRGYKVLLTKEPGTTHLPITMKLREIMLSNEFDSQLTVKSREYISQAIRNIHIEKLILPSLEKYDFIIQDRGILSGLAYGEACGNDISFLKLLNSHSCDMYKLYDDVIYLKGNVKDSLSKALTSKKEFESGDAMEGKGLSFMEIVSDNMDIHSKNFNTLYVNITDKDIEDVFKEIKMLLKI